MADVVTLEYESQEAAPEALRPLLVKDEASGKFLTKLAPAAKVDEFRTNNIEARKRADALEQKLRDYDGLDPKAAREWKAELDKLKGGNGQQGTAGADPDTIKKLIKEATADIEQRLNAERELRAKAEEREREKDFDAQLADAASKTPGFIPAALPDARERARRLFANEGGAWVLKQDGEIKRRADGEAYTPADWFANDLKKNAPHFFAAGVNGGGAAGGSNSAGGASHVISRADAQDVTKYRAARAAAEKRGVPLEIVG